ncbi:tRNA-uridine aminocarboxypropyltransferase 1 [Coccinella septempunctata]|uniref:tRNA-uridine aminocarboxypropyltransferase 1 n=1 Tax=Coccinella septempunctata TaxID=41139 RepID=UPI001D078E40|nr:tRNA-uridine aminocarboxypropyltransferase 1 [Coccinella septempunctata]
MTHPKEDFVKNLDMNPFEGMIIEDDILLSQLDGRESCPKCNKSRKYYCYTCYVPIEKLTGRIPQVKLPIKIDIIKHKHEIDGKSTSGHAAVLAPEDVKVYTYPNIPDYSKEKVVLVFPSSNAITIPDLLKHNDYEELLKFKREPLEDIPKGYNRSTLLKKINKDSDVEFKIIKTLPVDKVIFIDSTWNQSKGIFKDPNINKIPCVVIANRISQFWRHQKGSPRWYLATIEAIHQFLIEIHLYKWGLDKDYKGIHNCFSENAILHLDQLFNQTESAYRGQYDNLLYFFKHMFRLIHTYYDHKDLYAYKRRLL